MGLRWSIWPPYVSELNEQGTVKRNSAVPVPLFREQWNREQLISDMTEQEQVQEQAEHGQGRNSGTGTGTGTPLFVQL